MLPLLLSYINDICSCSNTHITLGVILHLNWSIPWIHKKDHANYNINDLDSGMKSKESAGTPETKPKSAIIPKMFADLGAKSKKMLSSVKGIVPLARQTHSH